MKFFKGERVVWNGVQCEIHHFSEYGIGKTVAWLDGVPDDKRTLSGSWQMAQLSDLLKCQ